MKTLPFRYPHNPTENPAAILQAFQQAYPLEQVKRALRHCQQGGLGGKAAAEEHLTLYQDLEVLLSALYQLPPKDAPSVAKALDTLHATINTNWVLLISPPE